MKIIIKNVEAKSGVKDDKPWELFIVTSLKGTEYTTFDNKVRGLGEGSEIEVGEVEEVKKGKFTNFKFDSAEIIKAVKAEDNGNGHRESTPYKRDVEGIKFEYDLKAQLARRERLSIETQTAYNGIIALATQPNPAVKFEAPDAHRLLEKALKWAESRIDASTLALAASLQPDTKPQTKGKAEVENGKGVVLDPETPFPHVGAMLEWWTKQGGTRPEALKLMGCKEADLAKLDISSGYEVLKDNLPKKEAVSSDPEGLWD